MNEKEKELLEFIKAELKKDNPNTIVTQIDGKTGLPEQISFSDFGQSWIDKIISQCLPGINVASPMIASMIYGNYFREFDTWRASLHLKGLNSHQGVLIFGKDFRTSCLRLAARDSMTDWYGRRFEGETVGFFCIDRNLVQEIARSFFDLVAPGYPATVAAQKWIKELSSGRARSGRLNSDMVRDVIEPAHNRFARTCLYLQDIFGTSPATDVLDRFLGKRSCPLSDKDERWIWSYCESVVLHFIMGHEFGHYVFKNPRHPYAQTIAHHTKALAEGDPGEGIFEESFCDVVGLENCLFQMNFFEIPPAFTLAVTAWTLAITESLAKGLHDVADQTARLDVWAGYWQRRAGLDDRFSSAASPMLSSLKPLSEAVVAQLVRLAKRK